MTLFLPDRGYNTSAWECSAKIAKSRSKNEYKSIFLHPLLFRVCCLLGRAIEKNQNLATVHPGLGTLLKEGANPPTNPNPATSHRSQETLLMERVNLPTNPNPAMVHPNHDDRLIKVKVGVEEELESQATDQLVALGAVFSLRLQLLHTRPVRGPSGMTGI